MNTTLLLGFADMVDANNSKTKGEEHYVKSCLLDHRS